MATHSIKDIVDRYETFDDFGFCSLENPVSLSFYEDWIGDGYHGEMAYLKDHLPAKQQPQTLLPKARSAIVVAKNYYPTVGNIEVSKKGLPEGGSVPSHLRTALYSRGEDYHFWFQKEIDQLCTDLALSFPEEKFLGFTDSKPVLERDLAYKAGLGWFGKNTCLIDSQRGSLFLIGEIYTTLELQSFKPLHPDHCGTCTRCIDACPTGAIVEDRKLDARKCISYLTIEAKGLPPEELRHEMGDWFFGCDICQTVCPWNEKVFGAEDMRALSDTENTEDVSGLIAEIKWILEASNNQLEKQFAGSPLSRARGRGLKRNAIIVATNKRLREVAPAIKGHKDDPRLSSFVSWSLEHLTS